MSPFHPVVRLHAMHMKDHCDLPTGGAMLEADSLAIHRELVGAMDDDRRIEDPIPVLLPGHSLVIAHVRHKHDGRLYFPGQIYWMQNHRIKANEEAQLISVVGQNPCSYWREAGRILGAESVTGIRPLLGHETAGALKILSGVGYDPGSAAYRLHTAINETTKHSSVFVRWADANPHCSLRQYDGEGDIATVRDAFLQADVIHCHVAYLLINNLGIRPTDKQLLVRHYHGSKVNGTHIDANLDRYRQSKLFGARLTLLAEASQFGLEMEWSPIPMAVQRYRLLRDVSRAAAQWTPLEGAATEARPLVVGHSPTNMGIKGTSVLRTVVENLQRRGVPIRLELIHGVSLRQSFERKALCDVVFDSFWLGIQGSGLEAGAMQIPVIAGDESVRALYTKEIGGAPYTFANDEQELTWALERMAMDPEWRGAETRRVSQYVEEHHDYAAVGTRYERSIAGWTGRDDIYTPRI